MRRNYKECNSHKRPKQLPYGSTRGLYWCHGCDAQLVSDYSYKPKKKQARQKNKKYLRNFKEE